MHAKLAILATWGVLFACWRCLLYHRCEVKVIDLGSSCFITDHLSSYVQSRSYRAPEVILGLPYGQKIDIWSLGCILAELATGYVLFQVRDRVKGCSTARLDAMIMRLKAAWCLAGWQTSCWRRRLAVSALQQMYSLQGCVLANDAACCSCPPSGQCCSMLLGRYVCQAQQAALYASTQPCITRVRLLLAHTCSECASVLGHECCMLRPLVHVCLQNDSLATLLARLEGILGPLPSWMVAQGRYSNRYYTRSRQLYERSKSHGR